MATVLGSRSIFQSPRSVQSACHVRVGKPSLRPALLLPRGLRINVKSFSKADEAVCLSKEASGAAPLPADLTRRALLQAAVAVLLLEPVVSWESALAVSGITRVFVAGATGNTGRRVVQQLRAKGYLVTAGARDVNKAKKLLGPGDSGVTVVAADVTKGASYLAAAMGDCQAVISTIGAAFSAASVDEAGAINLVEAAKTNGVVKFVMLSSLLTNAVAMGQAENPNYKFLNLFGQVLDHKLAAERYLRESGINYTIVRPGGLSNEPADKIGNLITKPEDTLFGLDTEPGREISRDTVAAVMVEALTQDTADNKVVEIVASPSAPVLSPQQWFP